MKIYKYNKKLVEEVGGAYSPVVFLNVLKDEDKDKCPHCGKPIPTEFTVVVESPNYKSMAEPIDTLTNDSLTK
jgi:hypothetical protein